MFMMHLVFSKGYLFFPAVRFYRLSWAQSIFPHQSSVSWRILLPSIGAFVELPAGVQSFCSRSSYLWGRCTSGSNRQFLLLCHWEFSETGCWHVRSLCGRIRVREDGRSLCLWRGILPRRSQIAVWTGCRKCRGRWRGGWYNNFYRTAVKYLRGFNGVMGYIFIALFTSPFAKAYQWKDIPRLWKAYCDGIHEKLGIMS